MSRQSKWREKKRSEGLCVQCGKNPLHTKAHCVGCAKKSNTKRLAAYHSQKNQERSDVL